MSKLVELTDRATGLPVLINPDNVVSCMIESAPGSGTNVKIWNNVDGEGPDVILVEAFDTPKVVREKLTGRYRPLRDQILIGVAAVIVALILVAL